MNKNYNDTESFSSEDEKDPFEIQSSEKTRHLCITDKAEEIEKVNESDPSSIVEIVVGLGDEVPLWHKGSTLKWKINPFTFESQANPVALIQQTRSLLAEAIAKWSDASPVKFEESSSDYDFEIIMKPDNCNPRGCTLASAFFPNSEQNILTVYPKMFTQSKHEQVETMIHELGHVFGLRHYFAKEREASWRSEIFGDHVPLTIMNYGHQSAFTEQDKTDLKALYSSVWNGKDKIGEIPVQLYHPYTHA